jgi:predicted RNA binding protein YcfA (HicA-like mRNA interferase family)
MPISYREAVVALRAAGFLVDRRNGPHEIWKHPDYPHARVALGNHGGNVPIRKNEARELSAALEIVAAPRGTDPPDQSKGSSN